MILKPEPLVSAIITTHNRADLLPRALDSVAGQTYVNMEIIVVDDGSTDKTPEVIEQYQKDISINYIRMKNSVGACNARNKGIEESEGKFVAGLDDDDKWHTKRVEELLTAYSDDYAAVTSDIIMAYPNREIVWKKKEVIELNTLFYTNQIGNQVLARRDRILAVGGFDSSLVAAQDYDLWIRLCKKFGPIYNVQKPLQTVYMNHKENRITDNSSFEGYLQFYKKHKKSFNYCQRKYQLYNIRRTKKKPLSFTEFISCVPPFRYWSEIKKEIATKVLNN